MYTTACEECRKVRSRCIRSSQGRDPGEVCERCTGRGLPCLTVRRRVGRQPGTKNRKPRTRPPGLVGAGGVHTEHDADDTPNPLHILAFEAVATPEPTLVVETEDTGQARSSDAILDRFTEWTDILNMTISRETLSHRLDALLVGQTPLDANEPSVFSGRTDMERPDAAPERDVISLQIVTLAEAQRLFDGFLDLVSNGSMYFDRRLHTLSFVRQRSSFLLATILAAASTYSRLSPSSRLFTDLSAHAAKLEVYVRNNYLKSVEITQALLLMASWAEVPNNLGHERTWVHVSQAIAMAVELRLDLPVPYCVQSDPQYVQLGQLLVRNAQRVCLLLYIHDRNMAMVAGRFPVFPESYLTSKASLQKWGRHPVRLNSSRDAGFQANRELIEQSMEEWREQWAEEITVTAEYDIIARFSTFMLALKLLKHSDAGSESEKSAREWCETLSFEVCCATLFHYKTWKGLLNSCTFDTCMVAFAATYTIQSVNRSTHLSDWSLFRLATLQELIADLEAQAAARHHIAGGDGTSVVDAMAKQLSRAVRVVLSRKSTQRPTPSTAVPDTSAEAMAVPPHAAQMNDEDAARLFHPAVMFDHGNSQSVSLPFIPEWNLDNLLPDTMFPWNADLNVDLSMDLYDINQFM